MDVEMEKEMAMRAGMDIERFQDTTPALPPLSFSLYDSSLSSHCSFCFRPLSSGTATSFLNYCSNGGGCSAIDIPLHLSSAEHQLFRLLHSHPSLFPHSDSSDLRASLRLLHTHLLSPPVSPHSPRLLSLLTNRRKLLESSSSRVRVRDGARVMAMARAVRDGREFDDDGDCVLEEAVLCLVITNAVEINVTGERPIGIGVYDWRFSWINHSCSPNSCYRFLYAFEDYSEGDFAIRIGPCRDEADRMVETVESSDCTNCGLVKGHGNQGPRVLVRSIKAIKKGEEVTITYTDLLQPTTLRQSELSLKFQFICECRRCGSVPQTYVDLALEETFVICCHNSIQRSLIDQYKENALKIFRDVFDDSIMEYMEVGDPVSCFQKIEALLSQGVCIQHLVETKGVSRIDFRLSPLHHLSLNAYTTLSSTYKICANQSDDGKLFDSFNMSRISTAYSLLLAGATHYLFSSDLSFIASAAIFWTNAGEVLLYLARNPSWNLFPNCVLENDSSSSKMNCPRCLLMDKFESNSSSNQTPNGEFDDISREFLVCISTITPKVWTFLVQGCQYLKDIKDPFDFSWLGSMRTPFIPDANTLHHHRFYLCGEGDVDEVKCDYRRPAHERTNIFELGIHCLLYGGYLSCICYDRHQYITSSIKNMLNC